jgi:SAM-dependent methyltransferase
LHGSQLVSSDYDEILSRLPALTATTPGEAVVTQAAGRQYWADLTRQPLTYYYSTGPVGDLFQAFSGPLKKKELAFIGLGTGSLLAYGEPGQHITVFEINPAIVRIAENPEYFTFASTCRADPWPDGRHFRLVMGDARLSLEHEPDGRFGIIMVDAFSSDAIPVHLITREAIELYLKKLAPGGIIALHISNRYLDLEPVTAVLAMNLNLAARIRSKNVTTAESRQGKSSSTWVILARDEKDLYPLTENPEWLSFDEDTQGPLWTDDFSNIFSIFRWKP